MARLTNNHGIDLSLAVWLAHDDYDYVDKENYISVTTLIKPLRQIILPMRIPKDDSAPVDLMDRFRSRLGQSIHAALEMAWTSHYQGSMKALGYPQKIIDKVRVNPEQQEPDTLPVFTEIREEREIEGFTIGGKFDLILEGRVRDLKMTSVWSYLKQKSVGQWRLQGSLYRWLNPEKVKHDELFIQYLLLDWHNSGIKRDPNYPPIPVPTRSIDLLGYEETEHWVRNKLGLLKQYIGAPEDQIPECSDEDLWRDDPKFKYYSDPAKAALGGRSTKNFDNQADAEIHKANLGKGAIVAVPGLVRACNYCPAAPICSQFQRMFAAGLIAE